MKKKLRIGILFGGRSGEHEVSLLSAASILKAIDRNKYDVVPIGIDKQGHWLSGSAAQRLLDLGEDRHAVLHALMNTIRAAGTSEDAIGAALSDLPPEGLG